MADHVTEDSASAPKTEAAAPDYQQLYQREQHGRRVATGVSLVVGVLAIVAVAGLAVANHRAQLVTQRSAAGTAVAPRIGFRGGMMRGRAMVGRTGTSLNQFLKSDGSVDTQAVTNFLNQATASNKSLVIDRLNTAVDQAAAAGRITADQAKALHAAIGSPTTASAQG